MIDDKETQSQKERDWIRVKFLVRAYLRQQNMCNGNQNHELQLDVIIVDYFNIGVCTQMIVDGVHKRQCKNIACNYCIFGKHPKCNGHVFTEAFLL